jgi:hypothetical protein
MIDQYPSHRLRRDRKEMPSILPSCLSLIDQLQVGLMYQRRGLQGVPGPLTPEIGGSATPKLVVNLRKKLLERFRPSLAPSAKKFRSISVLVGSSIHRYAGCG